jgi:hypothetical protein
MPVATMRGIVKSNSYPNKKEVLRPKARKLKKIQIKKEQNPFFLPPKSHPVA